MLDALKIGVNAEHGQRQRGDGLKLLWLRRLARRQSDSRVERLPVERLQRGRVASVSNEPLAAPNNDRMGPEPAYVFD